MHNDHLEILAWCLVFHFHSLILGWKRTRYINYSVFVKSSLRVKFTFHPTVKQQDVMDPCLQNKACGCLVGNARTHTIACVHSGARCFRDTLSTMRFSCMTKLIKNTAVLYDDVRKLKIKLASTTNLSHSSGAAGYQFSARVYEGRTCMGFVGSDSVKLIPFLMTVSESAVALQPMADSLGDRIPKPIKEHSGLPRETLICKCADSKRTQSARQRVKKDQSIVERQWHSAPGLIALKKR